MHFCRALVPTLVLMTALAGAEPTVPPAVTAPATEAPASDAVLVARMSALIDTAVAHGLPDGTGAVLFKGKLAVIDDKPKPDADGTVVIPPVNPMEQMGGKRKEDDQHITTTYDGVHARLKDGSYLVKLGYLKLPSATRTFQVDDLKEIKPTELRTEFKPRHEPSADELAEITKVMSANQIAGMKAAMRWSGLLESMQYQGTALAAAVLIRAGVPDAHELAWAEMFRAMGGRQLTKEGASLYLNQEDAQAGMQQLSKRMQERFAAMQKGAKAEQIILDVALDDYLRQGLQTWFRTQIGAGSADLTEAKAIAGLSALLGGAADPDQREELRLFSEFAALPATVAVDAPLADRLARWAPTELPMGMSPKMLEHVPAEQLAKMGYKPGAGPEISAADRAGLFALLDDQRASAWLDRGPAWGMMGNGPTPRTRGDNALRALAGQYGFDPRLLVGRDQFAGWNAAERSATAKALQAWFTAHGSEPVEGILAAVVKDLPAGRAAALIGARPESERPALIAAVVAGWKSAQPTGPAAEGLGEMLALAKDDPAAATVVGTWPVEGEFRLLFALWHELHGESKPLDALIPEVLAAALQAMPGMPDPERAGLLAILAARPTAARLATLKIQLADPSSSAGKAIMQMVFGHQWRAWNTPGLMALLGNQQQQAPKAMALLGNQQQQAPKAMGFSLMADVLANRNPLPAGKVVVQPWGLQVDGVNVMNRNQGNKKADAIIPAADLRWCDLAASAVVGNPWSYRSEEGEKTDELTFDLAAPIAERDAQIAAIRIAIDPVISAACIAAKLPTPTGSAPAPANDKALF